MILVSVLMVMYLLLIMLAIWVLQFHVICHLRCTSATRC